MLVIAPPVLTDEQAVAVAEITDELHGRKRAEPAARRRRAPPVHAVLAPRRHRQRQDRGLPARDRRGARRGQDGARARARDLADARSSRRGSARGSATSSRSCTRAVRAGAARRVVAAPPRRCADRGRRALGGVRAARGPRRDRRRRGARRLVQAGRGRALPRARRRAGPGAARGRGVRARIGDARASRARRMPSAATIASSR